MYIGMIVALDDTIGLVEIDGERSYFERAPNDGLVLFDTVQVAFNKQKPWVIEQVVKVYLPFGREVV